MFHNEQLFEDVVMQGAAMAPHAMLLSRAIRQAAAWPASPADRVAWLHVDMASLLLDGTCLGSRDAIPTEAQFAQVHQHLESCLQAADVCECLSVDVLLGSLTFLVIMARLLGFSAVACKLAEMLETQLLRLAARGPPSQLMPAVPLVWTGSQLLAGSGVSVDRLIPVCACLASVACIIGETRYQERCAVLATAVSKKIFELVPAGHLNGDLGVLCVLLTLPSFFYMPNDFHHWVCRSDELLPHCRRPTFSRNSILLVRMVTGFHEGNFKQVLSLFQTARAHNAQVQVASKYVSAGAAGELLSVFGDHYFTIFTCVAGCMLAIHGQLEQAQAILEGGAARQIARVALGMPSAAHGDLALVGMAWVAQSRGDIALADRYLENAADAWRAAWLQGNRNISVYLISGMPVAAVLLLRRGELAKAAALATEFVKYPNWLPEQRDRDQLYGICSFVLGQVAAAGGDLHAAKAHLDRAHAALSDFDSEHWLRNDCQRARDVLELAKPSS